MKPKQYGWGGWKMPILHPSDPDYCEYGCPICVPARHGNKTAQAFQKIEMAVTFGGCPWGRARMKKHGVPPHVLAHSEGTRTSESPRQAGGGRAPGPAS